MTLETLQPSASPALTPAAAAPSARRSIGAVAAGLVAIFALTTATDVVLHASHVFPPMDAPPMSSALFLLAFAYRFVFDVAGCWLTARLAPRNALRHALVLGSIGVVLSLAGAVAMWDAGPAWYSLGLAASALPCAWIGARLNGDGAAARARW